MSIWPGRGAPQRQAEPLHIEVLNDREAVRRRLVGKEELVADMTEALFEMNPVGLDTTDPKEFRPEAETITLSLPSELSLDSLQRVIHEQFVNWFDADMAGELGRYRGAALAVAEVLRRHGMDVSEPHHDVETPESYEPRHAAPEGEELDAKAPAVDTQATAELEVEAAPAEDVVPHDPDTAIHGEPANQPDPRTVSRPPSSSSGSSGSSDGDGIVDLRGLAS